MTFSREIEIFIRDFVKELEENNAAVFAGAGLSAGAGYVDWKSLLRPIAEELGLDVDREHDLVTLAQYHENESGNRAKLNRRLLEEFSEAAELTENHILLARLPLSVFWTTNYDKLIERALVQENKRPDVKYTLEHLTQTKPKRDAVVYKMHGDIDHPANAVLTKDDYEKYHRDRDLYLTALAGDLVSKTFLFLGFSFEDPNLDYILSRVRVSVSQKNVRQHYALLRLINVKDFDEVADFEYSQRRQELFVNDLKRFGIKALLIDSYADITEILSRIHSLYRRKTIYISGAAHEYGRWTHEAAEILVRKISASLIRQGYKIASGFGLGVGSAVIAGALSELYMGKQDKGIEDGLLLRPFPQGEQSRELYSRYRQDIVSTSGVAIFVFGNKLDGDNVINSPGVEEEFNIACENGLAVIPIGATGYTSKALWEKVMENFDAYYPDNPALKEVFESLGREDFTDDDLVATLTQVLALLNRAA